MSYGYITKLHEKVERQPVRCHDRYGLAIRFFKDNLK